MDGVGGQTPGAGRPEAVCTSNFCVAAKRTFHETGEILPHVLVAMQRKIPNGLAAGWIAMAQNALDMLATSNLRGDDLRVLLALLGRLDFENLIQLEQADIAERLGMQRPHVNRSIKRLVTLGALLESPKIGRSRTYKLNPALWLEGERQRASEGPTDGGEGQGGRIFDSPQGRKSVSGHG